MRTNVPIIPKPDGVRLKLTTITMPYLMPTMRYAANKPLIVLETATKLQERRLFVEVERIAGPFGLHAGIQTRS
jgi:hypothetical protein